MHISRPWALGLASGYTLLIAGFLSWASLSASVFALPETLTGEPWFVTTCIDAWMGLFIITLWSWCFEKTWPKRALWFALIMGLGNLGVGFYLFKRIFALPSHFSLADFFLGQGQEKKELERGHA